MEPDAPARNNLQKRLSRRFFVQSCGLFFEDLWPRLWPTFSVLGLFIFVALIGVLPTLHPIAHVAVLAAFATVAIVLFVRALRGLRWPRREAALRRIERASGLQHRPLTAIEDTIAGDGDPAAQAVWRLHQHRAAAAAATARTGRPRPNVGRRDPRAIRVGAGLAVIVGLVVAGADAGTRLERAVRPNLAALVTAQAATFDIWITPPSYTGQPPLFIEAATPTPADVRVPSGSTLLAQVHNGRGDPVLAVAEDTLPFEAVDQANWRLEHTVTATSQVATTISLSQGRTELFSLPVTIVPDTPPTIAFAETPSATNRSALQVSYIAADDYGLATAAGVITLIDAVADTPPVVVDLPLPSLTEAGTQSPEPVLSFHDLTAHPWAGLPVEMQLSAVDATGQTGRGETVAFTLPERQFNHPVARELIAQRKHLVQAPDDRGPVIRALSAIIAAPQRYAEDLSVHLGLTALRSRLAHNRNQAIVGDTLQLMWDLALRIEDGGLSLAEQELRELQRQLQEALNNDNVTDEEIERLLSELRAALDRFFEAARENLREQLENGELTLQNIDPDALSLSQQDLEDLIDQAEDLTRLGARDAAREMLSQLQQMLENLGNQPMLAQPNPAQQQAEQLLDDLQRITRGQQRLLDETFRQSREGQQPGDDELGAAAQELLRRELGEAMRQLGEALGDIPAPLGNAEQSMRQSTESLAGGDPNGALGPQGDALDQLRAGARAAAQQFAEQFGPGGQGQQPGQFGQAPGQQNTDPFGRRLDGDQGLDTGDIAIPSESERQRARQILDELRRRAGERARPLLEQEYIDRLLRRF